MKRIVMTAADDGEVMIVEREELTEQGWERRSLAVAMPCVVWHQGPYREHIPMFVNHHFLIEEER